MKLSPRELDSLLIHQAGFLAQKRFARGCKLNHPEAVALIACQNNANLEPAMIIVICTQTVGGNSLGYAYENVILPGIKTGTFGKVLCHRLLKPSPEGATNASIQEFARNGCTVAELMSRGRVLLGRNQVMKGVEDLVQEVQVEATFPDGTKLLQNARNNAADTRVTVSHPIARENGDLDLALDGSFLPVPSVTIFQMKEDSNEDSPIKRSPPGSVYPSKNKTPIHINAGRKRIRLTVASTCDRPIQVGSHYHFIEANKQLVFDRILSYGMRLDVPAGSAVRFEPGDIKDVTLVEIGGRKIVRGGNSICDGKIEQKNITTVMERVKGGGFGNKTQIRLLQALPCKMSRFLYAKNYGPTLGDKVRLGDTCLVIEVEKDFAIYGEECKFGGGKVLREGMGQASLVVSEDALDTVITNCLIVDAVQGIVKADLGIKGSNIVGIGKAGNPDIMDHVTDGMVIGTSTEVIAGEGLILTAGGIDSHIHFICPQLVKNSISSGMTTLIGGGTGPATGTRATTCSPGPFHIRAMIQSTDEFPMNFGFTGKGNTTDTEFLSRALIEQVEAGAIGLKLHEDWGSTPAAIDSCLRVADAYDVQVLIHTDTLNESSCVEDTIAAFKGRTIHTYHTEGAGGGHAPDIIKVCSEPNCIPSSTNPTRPFTRNTIDEHLDMLLVCHHLNKNLKEDLAFAESRIRAETIAAEDILHDMGAISIMSSDSQAMGRVSEVICRTWQTADKMKKFRGPLPEDNLENDNHRVKRFIAKYTINAAIAQGVSHVVGSVEVGKMADLVLWNPGFFGAKPSIIIKGGQIAWSEMGLPNASIPTVEPVKFRKMFGAYGKCQSRNSCIFVSKSSLSKGVIETYGIDKEAIAVKNCRNISKKNMVHNASLPRLRVDPETYKVYAAENVNGEEVWTHLTCEPAKSVPLAGRYFLF